jgi:endonuclease YncB( thermonuclease family)
MRYVLLLLAVFPAWVAAQAYSGRVVAVNDGDTVTVLDTANQSHVLRLVGIDAPEQLQAFGQKSKTSLAALVFNRDVDVLGEKPDRKWGTVAKIMVANTNCNAPSCPKVNDVGLMQVTTGMAWWYRRYAKDQSPQDRQDYEIAEFQAQSRRVGLWNDKNPIPPWEWRRDR